MLFTIIDKKIPILIENKKGVLVNIYVDKIERINKTSNLPNEINYYTYDEILAKFNITKEKPFIIAENNVANSEEKNNEKIKNKNETVKVENEVKNK